MGVPIERIQRLGDKDNFWAAGPTGPCGPCSELYYDFHPERGTENATVEDDSRFIEFYNLVFMENNRSLDGSLTPLANKNIDTGMGLERMAQILQRVPNNYETDLIFPIVQRAAEVRRRRCAAFRCSCVTRARRVAACPHRLCERRRDDQNTAQGDWRPHSCRHVPHLRRRASVERWPWLHRSPPDSARRAQRPPAWHPRRRCFYPEGGRGGRGFVDRLRSCCGSQRGCVSLFSCKRSPTHS